MAKGGGINVSNKSTWKKVRLGDVVHQLKDSVDAETCGLEYYLGGEHFNTDDLHTNGRGTILGSTIGPAFTMRFRPGHVLIVSRNPHLRKMAVTDFEGICSNVTYVCETKSDDLLQEFLPFIIRSSNFWRFAEANKRGSTNFYLNWSDFAQYEFLLPPIEEQKHIAEILWTADEAIEKQAILVNDLKVLKTAMIDDFSDNHTETIKLGELLSDVKYGTSTRISPRKDNSVPVLRIPNISRGMITYENIGWVELSEKEIARYSLSSGDILLVRTNGNPDYVGRATLVDNKAAGYVYASYLIRIKCKNSLNPEFLHIFLNHTTVRNKLLQEIKSSAGNYNLNTQGIKNLEIPHVSEKAQLHLINKVAVVERSLSQATQQIEFGRELLLQLIQHYLGGAN